MAKAKREMVELKPISINEIQVQIVGDRPLIVNRWSEKALKNMQDKQAKKTVTREPRDPDADYEASKYLLPDGSPGFPADGFKAAIVRAANDAGMPMTKAREAFFVMGEYSERDRRDLVRIEGEYRMRSDPVRLETGVASIAYRSELPEWQSILTIQYNSNRISAEQLINMLNVAGFGVGVGEWRPAGRRSSGSFGRFHVIEKMK